MAKVVYIVRILLAKKCLLGSDFIFQNHHLKKV